MVNYKLVSASVTYKIDHLFNNFITRPKLDCLTGKSIDKNYFLHMSTGQQESLFYPLYYLVTMQEINSIKSFLWKLKRQDSQSLTLMPFSSIPNDRILKHHRSLYPFQLCWKIWILFPNVDSKNKFKWLAYFTLRFSFIFMQINNVYKYTCIYQLWYEKGPLLYIMFKHNEDSS